MENYEEKKKKNQNRTNRISPIIFQILQFQVGSIIVSTINAK